MVMPRLGFLDRRLVVPASAEIGVAGQHRRSDIGGLGFAVATTSESRTAPGRELVDLGSSLIQTRIHHRLLVPMREPSWCARLVLLWLPKFDIVAAFGRCKVIKKSH